MIRAPLLALALALPVPALALTPEELWAGWQAQMQGAFGVTLSAEAVPGADGSLTLRSIAGSVDGGPAQPLPPESPVQQIVLTPTGSGSVLIDLGMPERQVIPGGGDRLGDLLIEHRGLSILALREEDSVEYEVRADTVRFATLGAPGLDDGQVVAGEATGLLLRTPLDVGPDRMATFLVGVDGFAYVTSLLDPLMGTLNSQAVRADSALSVSGFVTLPQGVTLESLENLAFADALARGLVLRLEFLGGGGSQTASYEGFPFGYRTETTSQPGKANLSLDANGFLVRAEAGGGTAVVTSEEMPFGPLDLSYGPMEAEVTLPFGTLPRDGRYLVSFRDLALGEGAWAQIDPQGLLPRDPLSFEMDLGGRMAIDLADLEMAPGAAARSLLETLELRSFAVKGLGVDAAATGTLTFPGGDVNQPPTGQAQATLTGADSLLAALQQMGWITEDDAFSARIGLAAFFGPAKDLDRREATMELQADGSVVVNGVPLP
jgi:hypothetical protein